MQVHEVEVPCSACVVFRDLEQIGGLQRRIPGQMSEQEGQGEAGTLWGATPQSESNFLTINPDVASLRTCFLTSFHDLQGVYDDQV